MSLFVIDFLESESISNRVDCKFFLGDNAPRSS